MRYWSQAWDRSAATLMLAKAMGAQKLIGVDVVKERCELALKKAGRPCIYQRSRYA